ncbi:hypothetical protein GCM10023321_60150 [Pseudonocardia eucalypti]|uniref:Uncharacterized protein n=1 Tax=Pseudonocardia eucalypti TaxID=648755 RepID=A0ABP9QUX2_9PSEU|nr:hypothetical protein [Pseudonocardia eucalypti]
MVKKVGIVLAATVAALLSVSPLAFAGDYNGDDDDRGGKKCHKCDDDNDHDGDRRDRKSNVQSGLININGLGVQAPIQACNNSLLTGALGILSSGVHNKDKHNGSCEQNNSND